MEDRIPENWNNLCPEREREDHSTRCNSINCYQKYLDLSWPPEGDEPVMTLEEWLAPRI